MFISFVTRSWILLTVLDFATTQENQSLKTCKITDDIEGECILLQNCPRAMDLLKLNDRKSLKELTCGYENRDAKVCCVTQKTDGASITFKNTTQDAATSRPDTDLPSSMKVPPDPVATSNKIPTSSATTEQTTKVYSTTFAVTTSHVPKRTNITHHHQLHQPTLPPMALSSSLPQATPPASAFATPTETTPTFDNPLGIGESIPNKSNADTDQQYDLSELHSEAANVGTTEKTEHAPSVTNALNFLPARNECGPLSNSDRIFGGQVAGLDELPWMARIKYLVGSNEVYACHASLITDRLLITAAHCLVEGDVKIIDVRLGEWDAETEIDCIQDDCNDPPVDVKIDQIYVHPSYNRRARIGDIGILRLAKRVNFTEFIRPVCLPTTDYISRIDYDPENEYVTGGWGKTEYESRSVIKRKITLKAVPIQTCRAAIRWPSEHLALSAICAGGRKGEDTCSGDSGGPLVRIVTENRRVNWFLYGVTSFGSSRCGTEGVPGIYTRVTYYMDWIKSVIVSAQ